MIVSLAIVMVPSANVTTLLANVTIPSVDIIAVVLEDFLSSLDERKH